MLRYILGRLGGLLLVLVLVSIMAFVLMHAVPGGPFDEYQMPLPPAAKANMMAKYGLDRPLWEQYLRYMSNALRGDFGISYQSASETVIGVIARTWPVSMALGGITIVFALGGGVCLGIIAALKQNTWIDYTVTFCATLGLTVPNFVIAIWMILIFAVQLRWLPIGGWSSDWHTWVMPAIALGLGPLGIAARYTRASMVEVMGADYVRTARAKGLRDRVIVLRHILRNALIPILTALAPRVPDLITGTIFVETMFRVPGIGKFFVTSVFQRDYPLIMALMLLAAALWGLMYLLTDLVSVIIDPRVRLS